MAVNKVLLITTFGCEGCKIQNNLLTKAIQSLDIPIEYEVKDCFEIDKQFIIDNFITDYPATLIMKDNVVKQKIIGTQPIPNLIQIFKKEFNQKENE